MSKDPRHDLDKLIAALERHFEVALSINEDVEDSEVLTDAEDKLRDAFFTYDDTLFTTTGAELPFDILDDDFDDDDDDEDDEFEEDVEDADPDYIDEDELEDFDLDED